jgi:hypothetical protein
MKNISVGHCDELNYNPSKEGLPIARLNFRNLTPSSGDKRDKIFQFDGHFSKFRENKELCRKERLNKYYQDMGYSKKDFTEYILNVWESENQEEFRVQRGDDKIVVTCKLTKEILVFDKEYNYLQDEGKTDFKYVDEVDAISMQVPEDIILQRMRDDYDDYIGSIHLCAANDWSAEKSINQSMKFVHKKVPYIKKVISSDRNIVRSILKNNNVFERTGAVNFYTESFINKHPDNNIEEKSISRLLDGEGSLFLRFERQTITPIKGEYFIFTIRTYFSDIKELTKENRNYLKESFFAKADRINTFTSASSEIRNREKEFVEWVDAIE